MRGTGKPDQNEVVIGIDLGGTKTAVAAVDRQGRVVRSTTFATLAEQGKEALLDRLIRAVQDVATAQTRAIGIGVPGLVDARQGLLWLAPNLPSWRDVPVRQLLEDRTGLPVVVDNDANVAAIAEHRLGAARGVDDFAYITVGTGIGGALVLGGQLYRGVLGTAGEIGHTTVDPDGPICPGCGAPGCLEALAAGPAIARRARERLAAGERGDRLIRLVSGDLDTISAVEVQAAAEAGDPLARSVLEEAGTYLGIAIANLADLLNPALVVVGGGVAQSGDLLLAPAREAVRRHALPKPSEVLRVALGALGRDAGVLGAALLAWDLIPPSKAPG